MEKLDVKLLAKRLEQLRKAKGWKRGQVMLYLKISPASVHRWETGWKNVQLDTYVRVKKKLDAAFAEIEKERAAKAKEVKKPATASAKP